MVGHGNRVEPGPFGRTGDLSDRFGGEKLVGAIRLIGR
jgi:hypothetical protein